MPVALKRRLSSSSGEIHSSPRNESFSRHVTGWLFQRAPVFSSEFAGVGVGVREDLVLCMFIPQSFRSQTDSRGGGRRGGEHARPRQTRDMDKETKPPVAAYRTVRNQNTTSLCVRTVKELHLRARVTLHVDVLLLATTTNYSLQNRAGRRDFFLMSVKDYAGPANFSLSHTQTHHNFTCTEKFFPLRERSDTVASSNWSHEASSQVVEASRPLSITAWRS